MGREIMKIQEIIQEFIPCEVCGNSDISNFYFHVFAHWGSEPFVKCCECEEEYYSRSAKEVLNGIERNRKVKIEKDRKAKKPKALVTLRPEEDCEIREYAR
jgi:hypothetical protein